MSKRRSRQTSVLVTEKAWKSSWTLCYWGNNFLCISASAKVAIINQSINHCKDLLSHVHTTVQLLLDYNWIIITKSLPDNYTLWLNHKMQCFVVHCTSSAILNSSVIKTSKKASIILNLIITRKSDVNMPLAAGNVNLISVSLCRQQTSLTMHAYKIVYLTLNIQKLLVQINTEM